MTSAPIDPLLVAALAGGLLPGMAAAGVFVIVARLPATARLAWPAAVAVGYVAGHITLEATRNGLPVALTRPFAPVQAQDWLPAIAVAGLCASALLHAFAHPTVVLAVGLSLGIALPRGLLAGSKYFPSQELRDAGFADSALASDAVAWLIFTTTSFVVGGLLLWGWQRSEANGLRSALVIAILLLTAATAALTGSFTVGQLFGILAAAVTGAGIAARIGRRAIGPEQASAPLLALMTSLLVLATFYSEMQAWHAGSLGVAILCAAAWLPAYIGLAWRSLLCLALAVLPPGQVLGNMWKSAAEDTEDSRELGPSPADDANPYSQYR